MNRKPLLEKSNGSMHMFHAQRYKTPLRSAPQMPIVDVKLTNDQRMALLLIMFAMSPINDDTVFHNDAFMKTLLLNVPMLETVAFTFTHEGKKVSRTIGEIFKNVRYPDAPVSSTSTARFTKPRTSTIMNKLKKFQGLDTLFDYCADNKDAITSYFSTNPSAESYKIEFLQNIDQYNPKEKKVVKVNTQDILITKAKWNDLGTSFTKETFNTEFSLESASYNANISTLQKTFMINDGTDAMTMILMTQSILLKR